jgi:hypothetical protein
MECWHRIGLAFWGIFSNPEIFQKKTRVGFEPKITLTWNESLPLDQDSITRLRYSTVHYAYVVTNS